MKIESMDASYSATSKSVRTPQSSDQKINISDKISKNKNFDPNSVESKKIGNITEQQKQEMPLSEKVVIDAIEKANKAISLVNKEFHFSIHEETKQILIKVLDKDTEEIIGEFPSEKILDMVAKIVEKSGVMFDERR